MKLATLARFVTALLIPQIVATLGLTFTVSSISGWYASLNQPHTTPPNTLFGPVWTILYLLMGIALFLVWNSNKKHSRRAYWAFGVQLLLNLGWSAIFFAGHQISLAFIEIIVLMAAIIWNIYEFSRIKRTAAWLLTPYLAWVCFAAILNYQFWMINR